RRGVGGERGVRDRGRGRERRGLASATSLPVDRYGRVDPDDVRKAITDKTVLVTIMFANNEIGTVQPLAEIGQITREKGALFPTDGVEGIGTLPLDVEEMHIDLLSLTAHKIYGPKGVGALYVRSKSPRVRLTPIIDGGGHERGMRSGTLNVPGIVGLGKACELVRRGRAEDAEHELRLRERLQKGIFSPAREV